MRAGRIATGNTHLSHSIERVNGGGVAALFVHATGFCSAVWRPVRDGLEASAVGLDFLAMDQRGHGSSGPLPRPVDWWDLGRDVLAVLGGRRDVIGVGHSSGGTALALAELLAPGSFRNLILIEPIIEPPPFRRIEDHPLAGAAMKRIESFPSRHAAEANYRGRGPFVGWDERAFSGYLECGLVDVTDGSVRLACRPADEAEFYRSANDHGGWGRLDEISTPVEIIAGEESDTHTPRFLHDLAGRLRQTRVNQVSGAGHFVSMQRPDVVAAAVAAAAGDWTTAGRR